jgi:hypothetical protein
MKKIRLDPEALDVLSFTLTDDAQPGAGTVQGHAGAVQGYTYSCTYPCKPRTYMTDCDC